MYLPKGGNFVLNVPGPMWKIIQQNNGMEGINLKPAPRPSADGSYSIKLTPAQWAKFQANQARPPVPQQASPAAGAAAPAGNDAPSGDSQNISVAQDPSMLRKSYPKQPFVYLNI